MPPGPLEKPHARNVHGPLYHYARDCAVLQVSHRCLSLRSRPCSDPELASRNGVVVRHMSGDCVNRRLTLYVFIYSAMSKREGTMIRDRALKVALVLVGLLFLAGIYPLTTSLWKMNQSDYGDDMMLSLYFPLGIFLVIAVRNPSANRSLIAFTAWSSFAHAVVMAVLAFHIPSERVGFLIAVAVLVAIGVVLIALAPAKSSRELASAAGA